MSSKEENRMVGIAEIQQGKLYAIAECPAQNLFVADSDGVNHSVCRGDILLCVSKNDDEIKFLFNGAILVLPYRINYRSSFIAAHRLTEAGYTMAVIQYTFLEINN